MAYAVSIKLAYSKTVVRFSTAEAALVGARDQFEHGAEDVGIRRAETGKEFAIDESASLFVDSKGLNSNAIDARV